MEPDSILGGGGELENSERKSEVEFGALYCYKIRGLELLAFTKSATGILVVGLS